MQRGYCSVATRYSPALIRDQALSSPEATLKVMLAHKTMRSFWYLMASDECLTAQKTAALSPWAIGSTLRTVLILLRHDSGDCRSWLELRRCLAAWAGSLAASSSTGSLARQTAPPESDTGLLSSGALPGHSPCTRAESTGWQQSRSLT